MPPAPLPPLPPLAPLAPLAPIQVPDRYEEFVTRSPPVFREATAAAVVWFAGRFADERSTAVGC